MYAFGVLLWELYSGHRAWEGCNPAQVIHAVAIEGRGLELPDSTPQAFARLAHLCMSTDMQLRPTFVEVEGMLRQITRDATVSRNRSVSCSLERLL